ncbi:uncharacterized protein LOC119070939 [Bradysia coprophila]|uniref:uncharacterized protein LOC119070939 n=1 Tax=Bradysia coprophila TaxID=38358 RepID=UPI00187DAD93|nr:uncharacterized protein LOC119070939 [Bradysia coprophila]
MKAIIFFILSVLLICASFVLADEPSTSTSTTTLATEDPDWKEKTQKVFDQTVDGAKQVGNAVAEKTKSGYVATKEYFSNNTVSDIAEDVADGAKNVGKTIADGAEKAWKGISGWFS